MQKNQITSNTIASRFTSTTDKTMVIVYGGGANNPVLRPSVSTSNNVGTVSQLSLVSSNDNVNNNICFLGCAVFVVDAPTGTEIIASEGQYWNGVKKGVAFISI